jgi:hypothetical protein
VYLIKQDKGSVYLKGGRYKIIHWFSTTLTPWFALTPWLVLPWRNLKQIRQLADTRLASK